MFGLSAMLAANVLAQDAVPPQVPTPAQPATTQPPPQLPGADVGTKGNPTGQPATGQDDKSASKPASASEESASATKLKLGPLDPSTKPTNVPHDRPVIGLALGGGAALGLTEVGVLRWFEEHHIPVDAIAVPFVFGPLRTQGTGQRVIIGVMVGIVFSLVQQITTYVGELLNLSPALTATMPSVLLLALALYLFRRAVA